MKEMVGGCCVCSDERGFYENPLVYCDGQGCNVAVHQACYGIVSVPTGPWFCRKCESQERQAKVRCELCPSKDGALKRTDNNSWAHVVCALYIPEVRFGNNNTMEPIILQLVPPERFQRTCSLCEEQGREAKSKQGACMQCNKQGCRHYFHVTCAQAAGLLCEEAGNNMDNVKYCGYCSHHYQKLKKEGGNIKIIPAFKPIPNDNSESSPEKLSPSRQLAAQHSTIIDGKHPKKKIAKTGSISSNASMASPSSVHSNSNHGFQSIKYESKAKNEINCEEITSSKVNSPVIADSSVTDKLVTDSTIKKKKKSNPSSASASPQTGLSNRDSSPPVLTPIREHDSKSGNSSPFASIFSSPSNSATNPAKVQQIRFSQPNEVNQNPVKRSKSDVNLDKKKFKKVVEQEQLPQPPLLPIMPVRTKSASKDYSDSRPFPTIKKPRKKKNEINCQDLPNGVLNWVNPLCVNPETDHNYHRSIPVNHPNMTPLQNGYSNANDKANSWFHGSAQNSLSMWSNESSVPPNNQSAKLNESINNDVPQTLEQLLERQWAQGSQFILDQAQHFDVASLLSCLHQLRSENNRLEERVRDLMTRRDQLLAVNARLAMPANNVFPINGALNPLNSASSAVNGQSGSPVSAHSALSAASSPRTHANSPSDFQNKNPRVSSPAQATSPSPARTLPPLHSPSDTLGHSSSQLYSTISQNLGPMANNTSGHSSPSQTHPFYSLTSQQHKNYIRKSNGSDKR